jgi:DnaJ-class molecular chaperone
MMADNAGKPFKIICDHCHGRRFPEGHLCEKCQGDGYLIITPMPVSFPIFRWLRDRWRWMKWFSWN